MSLEEEKVITTTCKTEKKPNFISESWVYSEIKLLDTVPRTCSVCGCANAYLKRVDHFLSLFSIPFLRVKKGSSFVLCETCEGLVSEFEAKRAGKAQRARCACGKELQGDFYCPSCGKAV